jgi:hypothetical protein
VFLSVMFDVHYTVSVLSRQFKMVATPLSGAPRSRERSEP